LTIEMAFREVTGAARTERSVQSTAFHSVEAVRVIRDAGGSRCGTRACCPRRMCRELAEWGSRLEVWHPPPIRGAETLVRGDA